jgi:hypothetical protein
MPAEELKPCPFCGSEAGIFGDKDAHFYAACKSKICFCSLGEKYDIDAMPEHIFGDKESAAYNWNQRANLSEGGINVPPTPQGRKSASVMVESFDCCDYCIKTRCNERTSQEDYSCFIGRRLSPVA